MALSTASTWQMEPGPFSTISKALRESVNELLPFENAFNGVDCVNMGNLDKLASVRLRTFPPTR